MSRQETLGHRDVHWLIIAACALLLVLAMTWGYGAARAEIVKSGTCGDNLTWLLDDEGTLTISGTGAMYDYSHSSPWGWGIKAVVIEEGVTNIGNYAFYSCDSLTSVTIPDSVTSIGKDAFYSCSSLTSITIPEGVTSISAYMFWGCSSLTGITIPDSVTSIGNGAFLGCSVLTNIAIPYGVTRIGSSAFYGCAQLKSITVPDSVISMGVSVFTGCSNLRMVKLPRNLTYLEPLIFDWDSEDGIFRDCFNLQKVIMPENIISIDDYSFYNCSSLKSITLPASVTEIGNETFNGCENLSEVCILGQTTTFGANIFSNNPTIYCYEYTDADSWATDNGYNIVYLDALDMDSVRTVGLTENFRLRMGESRKIDCYIFPDDRPEITWTSSDPSVLSVSDGVVTGLRPGTATITAAVGAVSDSVTITVYIPAESFDLNETEIWLVAKEPLQLSAINVHPERAEVTWLSSDTTLATVDESGLVTTKKPGDVTITAIGDNGVSRACLLHLCYPVTAVAFDLEALELKTGQAFPLTANVTMRTQSCVNHLVTFASSDEAVATVDADGVVTAHGVGTATITATAASGVSASCAVTVREADTLTLPAGLTAIEAEAFMGDTSLEAVIVPEGCAFIGARAFANCPNLIYIRIPASVTDVAENAFEGSDQVRIDRGE